jgi:hypothetical protein
MKKNLLLISFSLLSASIFAQPYHSEVSVEYANSDDSITTLSLQDSYYFDGVTIDNTAWAEAAFMGRNNSVSLDYTNYHYKNSNIDSYSLNLNGDYHYNNIFIGASILYIDTELNGFSADDTIVGAELGYFFDKNWLVSVNANNDDFSNSLTINTKYIATLSEQSFINLEASLNNESNDLLAAADYYWSPQSSVGLVLSTDSNLNAGLRGQHFFTPTVSAQINYFSYDYDDIYSVGLTGRF